MWSSSLVSPPKSAYRLFKHIPFLRHIAIFEAVREFPMIGIRGMPYDAPQQSEELIGDLTSGTNDLHDLLSQHAFTPIYWPLHCQKVVWSKQTSIFVVTFSPD